MRSSRPVAMAVMAVTLAACGARTGLLVPDLDAATVAPDVAVEPDVTTPFDGPPPPSCVPGRFSLTARAADVILVVDRSGSMNEGLGFATRAGPSKWQLLRAALGATLPIYQDQINVGALFFPENGAATRQATCALADIPDVDLDPATGNAPRVLGIFDATGPGGSTPTAAALLRAYTWIVRHPSRSRTRYIVLATDGGPNCNPDLDPSTCVCTSGGGGCRGGRGGGGNQCLDGTRTVGEIQQIAANAVSSVPVFVVGLSGAGDPGFQDTLTAMAVAGGRPDHTAAGQPTFYDIQQAGDLDRALTVIQNAIARCTFVTPSRPTATNGLTLTLDGATIPYDPTHQNGWDWTDRAFGQLTLFGAACPLSATPATMVAATVACEPDGG